MPTIASPSLPIPPGALVLARSLACGGLVFGLLALASLVFAREAGSVAAIWPANGVLLALVLLRPGTERPGLLVGALVGNIAVALAMGDAVPVSVGLALANILEISVIAWGMRGVDLRDAMVRWSSAARFIVLGGLVGPVASSVVACLTLAVWLDGPFGMNFVRWVVADALGMLVVAPPLLLMATPGAWPRGGSLTKRAGLAGILAAVLAVVFLQTQFPLLFLIPPVLILIAFRGGAGAAGIALLITAGTSLAAVAAGLGPLALVDGGLDLRAAIQQVFLAALVFTVLPVSAVLMERSRSEARYRLLAETASDIVARFDPQGRFLYVSPSASAVLGRDPETMLGQDCRGMIHEDDLPGIRDLFKAYVAAGPGAAAPRHEYRAVRPDGTVIWLEATPRAIYDSAGRLVEFHDCARDVTARKALERQLTEARDIAEEAARAKSEFLANMSHELRTPLTSVIGFSGLLQDSEALPNAERRYADRIGSASAALLSVINDILDYSKLEADAVGLDPAAFDPVAMAEGAAAMLEAQCRDKALTLRVEIDPDIPPAVMGDEGRLRQVTLNFLSNAVKFTSEGEVRLALTCRDDRLRLEVTDSGIGISAEKIDSLFERFTQADTSTTRVYGGTGLGLAISRRLIELMDGEIGAESEVGKGSTFWFEVPLIMGEIRDGAEADAARALPPGLRVLMADDAPANRELVRIMLGAWNISLDTVCDGAEAVQAVSTGDYDLVLMDVHMPVMDGLEAARSIRRLGTAPSAVPILALTANVQPDQIETCRNAGMDGHVGKPIEIASLVDTMARVLDMRSVRAQAA